MYNVKATLLRWRPPPPERPVISIPEFTPLADFLKALNSAGKHQVRAAGNIRVLLLGCSGRGGRKPTRPVATGTFAFPAFRFN